MKTQSPRPDHLLTEILSEALNEAMMAKVDINAESGNLTIDGLTGGEPVLASGTLEYSEKLGPPTRIVDSRDGQVYLTLKGKEPGKSWLRFPWTACNGATEWIIHLNPRVSFDITAFSGGGNLRLNLDGMEVTSVSANSGGGNMDIVLPDSISSLTVVAKTGAGNVEVHVPGGVEARIYATSGLGKVSVAPRFIKMDSNTYQSPSYDGAAYKVDITAKTGAGNVNIG